MVMPSLPVVYDPLGLAREEPPKHPLTALAEQVPLTTVELIDTLSARENRTRRFEALMSGVVGVTAHHSSVLAVGIRGRLDRDHFRASTHAKTEDLVPLLDIPVNRQRATVITQVDMW